ncbi:hypothetical protein EJB05_41066 [Eragrostis curvula]|uniref:SBP-type domain-containing protein n=1 Tax=Eragrostis curvula TaxID=38414 RepID=A0A5J9T8F5_9POAL|nr:hypothetical protein EJB05_41066 [Eragrostis curvula]
MGSSGMNWNHKYSMVWDWGNLTPVGPNTIENLNSGTLPKPRGADMVAIRHGSLSSSDATFTSSSEVGNGSSKSSLSAPIGSTLKEGNVLEFNFAAVSRHGMNMENGGAGRVEDSGISAQSMMAICHGEPLISLRLGKRNYFENVCEGQDVKNSTTRGATCPSTVVKKTKVSQQSTQPSCCQVEGCSVDLSSAKDYHRKHRICLAHSKAPKVVVAGLERRFCQQCSQLHGLAEFDQNKRSCRRRLSHHNARRRKPHTGAISFSSSRLSTMIYSDPRQQTNLFFNQPPFSQVRSNAVSSWDNPEGFRFTEMKFPSLKSKKMAGFDETGFSTSQLSNTVVAHDVRHHNLDVLVSLKGTNIKAVNQGVEASKIASNLNGAPVIGRALSLLSDDSWVSRPTVIQQSSSHAHPGAMMPLVDAATNPDMHELDSHPHPEGSGMALLHSTELRSFRHPHTSEYGPFR